MPVVLSTVDPLSLIGEDFFMAQEAIVYETNTQFHQFPNHPFDGSG